MPATAEMKRCDSRCEEPALSTANRRRQSRCRSVIPARTCRSLTPYGISTLATQPVEAVAAAAMGSPLWFQLYL
jgi:hypothetical protein